MDVSGTIDKILRQKSGEIWSITPDATVYDAIKLMAERNVGALLVMVNEQLVGIISERDYSRKVRRLLQIAVILAKARRWTKNLPA